MQGKTSQNATYRIPKYASTSSNAMHSSSGSIWVAFCPFTEGKVLDYRFDYRSFSRMNRDFKMLLNDELINIVVHSPYWMVPYKSHCTYDFILNAKPWERFLIESRMICSCCSSTFIMRKRMLLEKINVTQKLINNKNYTPLTLSLSYNYDEHNPYNKWELQQILCST